MKNLKKESILVFSLVGLAVASRLLPHPPNFAPITGIALFAAANFQKKWLAFLLPLCCLFITDLILGLSWINLFVYGAFALISLIGLRRKGLHFPSVLAGSVLFFIVSNFGVWLLYYPLTLEGLAACFTLAIPFFGNTLVATIIYSVVIECLYKFILDKKYFSNI